MTDVTGAPRPRVFVRGLTDEEVETVRQIAGSVRILVETEGYHAEEHDVLVAVDAEYWELNWEFHRRVVFAKAPEPPSEGVTASSVDWNSRFATSYNTRSETQVTPARDFLVTDEATQLGIAPLVRRSCLPAPGKRYVGLQLPAKPERMTTPLLQEELGQPLVLAALFELVGVEKQDDDSAFWLPQIAREFLREWLLFAFSHWRTTAPDVFPENAEWKKAEKWASPEEKSSKAALADFDREEAQRRDQVERERTQFVNAVSAAEPAGNAWRELLTATGEPLVQAVASALEQLGFVVIDADALPEHKGAKKEDLRVRDGDWTALVEIKGYSGSAKSNDLDQVRRAAHSFGIRERREPDALWYIPNVERDTDPRMRGQALAGRDGELHNFGESWNGCLIDTRDLFVLRQAVASGAKSSDQARQELKAARGRFSAS